jgi:uncharacterized membrane protein
MRFEDSIDVSAPADQVFEVYSDVERWPEWTESVTQVELLEEGPLRVGSRARVRQPRLPVAVWEVTEVVPHRSFTWVARGPGVRTTATHLVTPEGDGGQRAVVTATLVQAGLLGPVVGALTKRLTTRYISLELRGLKSRCES